jgi:hypothetical protein
MVLSVHFDAKMVIFHLLWLRRGRGLLRKIILWFILDASLIVRHWIPAEIESQRLTRLVSLQMVRIFELGKLRFWIIRILLDVIDSRLRVDLVLMKLVKYFICILLVQPTLVRVNALEPLHHWLIRINLNREQPLGWEWRLCLHLSLRLIIINRVNSLICVQIIDALALLILLILIKTGLKVLIQI